jgi:CheY-like chemotaxis protein
MSPQANGRPIAMLLVEDNAGDVRLTREALREGGVSSTIAVARDGVEALRYLRREGAHSGATRPDVVLLDLNLPRQDGWQVLQEMKADPALSAIPVVVLTSSQTERDIADAYDLGASRFITKPVDFEEYVRVMMTIEQICRSALDLPVKPWP